MAKLTRTSTPGLFRTEAGHYIVDKMVKGARVYENLNGVPLEVAQRILCKLVSEAVEGRFYSGKKSSLKLTVTQVLNLWWEGRIKRLKSARVEKVLMNRIADTCGDRLVETLNVNAIEEIREELLEIESRYGRPMSARYVNMALQALSRALNWAVKSGDLAKNPIKGYMSAPEATPKRICFDEGDQENGPQWRALVEAIDAEARPILIALYETGMRPTELFHMDWSWVRVVAEDRWTIDPPAEMEKTLSVRRIPVSTTLLAILKPMKQETGLVFPSSVTGRPRLSISKAFRSAVRTANLDGLGLTPYACRRTRLTIWDAKDGSACRFASGHAPADVHERHYVRISDRRLFGLVGLTLEVRETFNVVSAAG